MIVELHDFILILNFRSSFFTVHQDKELEQKMITQNRQAMAFCSGEKVALITGLELCGELQFPNASLVDEAPYFPLTGPVSMAVSLHKRDTFTGYKFEARSIHVSIGIIELNIFIISLQLTVRTTSKEIGLVFLLCICE